jgi:hypothetical protein
LKRKRRERTNREIRIGSERSRKKHKKRGGGKERSIKYKI